MPAIIALLVITILVVVVFTRAVRIVPQAFTGVVERLGRFNRTLPSGFHVLMPFLDTMRPLIDLREQVVTFPPQPVITEDNVTISIDTVIYYQIVDPVRSTYEVANLTLAMEQLAITTLRNVIGTLSLEQTLTSRDRINADLRVVMDEATERWGVRVNRIELKSVDPPTSIQEAMEKQMRAERDKRAAVLMAEGEKQAAILTAEGEKQATILRAEADKLAAVLRAQGQGEAIETVFAAIHRGNPTPEVLASRYLDVLPQVADGQATKLMLIPSDAMGHLGGLAAVGAAFQTGQDTAAGNGSTKRS
jgi:regulator of protease activity HflC (stomatin/prohibitin superfamily)